MAWLLLRQLRASLGYDTLALALPTALALAPPTSVHNFLPPSHLVPLALSLGSSRSIVHPHSGMGLSQSLGGSLRV